MTRAALNSKPPLRGHLARITRTRAASASDRQSSAAGQDVRITYGRGCRSGRSSRNSTLAGCRPRPAAGGHAAHCVQSCAHRNGGRHDAPAATSPTRKRFRETAPEPNVPGIPARQHACRVVRAACADSFVLRRLLLCEARRSCSGVGVGRRRNGSAFPARSVCCRGLQPRGDRGSRRLCTDRWLGIDQS